MLCFVFASMLLFVWYLLFIGSFFSIFFFKPKTAYEMRFSYWSSDVCSSDRLHVAQNRASLAIGHNIFEVEVNANHIAPIAHHQACIPFVMSAVGFHAAPITIDVLDGDLPLIGDLQASLRTLGIDH